MKRPSFQFYPADWKNNAKLRRCSEAARGAWIDVLCLMHDSDEYGVLRWPLSDIARAAGVPLKLLKELADRDVLKGGDKGCEAYIHTPIHARKKGEPVTLLEKTDGCCWYSSRFLTDEWRRSVSGGNTRFKPNNDSPDDSPSRGMVNGEVNGNDSPDDSPDIRLGAGATSTSTSSLKPKKLSEREETLTSDGGGNEKRALAQTTIPAEICKALVDLNVTGVNPARPDFLKLVEAGVTLDEVVEVAKEKTGKGFGYILTVVQRRREEAANLHVPPKPSDRFQIELGTSLTDDMAIPEGWDFVYGRTNSEKKLYPVEYIKRDQPHVLDFQKLKADRERGLL